MFTFDRTKFFDLYRERFGPLTQELVDALEFLLGRVEEDTRFAGTESDRRKVAYCLATFKWETAHTMRPIDERGGDRYFNTRYGPATKVGKRLGNTKAGDGARFHGRGYVQLTGRANYARAKTIIGVDLIGSPELAKDPLVAYGIAMQGMSDGWFTGKKLAHYFKDDTAPDWVNARRMINGLDQAERIADIARRFNEMLRFSIVV
jgi:putative chitinase